MANSASSTAASAASAVDGAGDGRAVDAVEEVEADVGLASHLQRLTEKASGVVPLATVEGHLCSALEGVGLAGRCGDGLVEPVGFDEVALGARELPGKQLCLAAQGEREAAAAGGAEPVGFGCERVGERDHVEIGRGAVEQSLGHAQLPIEQGDGKLREGRSVSHVESKAFLQLAAGVRRERVGPRRLDDGGRIAELERESPALGCVSRRERGIDQPDRGDAAERECAGEAPFEGHGLDVLDRSQGAREIADLELGERLLGADVRRPAVADGRSRGGVRGRCPAAPERVERRGSEQESLGMIGSVSEQGLDVVERVDERAEAHVPVGQPSAATRRLRRDDAHRASAARSVPARRRNVRVGVLRHGVRRFVDGA